MIKKMIPLAVLTFKEGLRDRALFGIGLFALFMMGISLTVVGFFLREIHKVAVDVNLSAIAFSGLLLTFFVSINLMSKDIDKHTIYCVMSKPFSRTQYIFGKYCGIMLLIASAFAILTVCSSATLLIIKAQYSAYFEAFSWLSFYKAVYCELLMFFVLNAFIIFYSSITTSSFITLLFSISTYIAGQTIEEVVLFIKSSQAAGDMILSETISRVIDVLQYILPNLSVFDIKIKSAHAITVSPEYLFAVTGYSVAYTSVLLIAASLIFSRRELK